MIERCKKHGWPLKNRKDKKGKYCVRCQQLVSLSRVGLGKSCGVKG